MLAIDHVVIRVADLDAAVSEYEGLGFTVTRGGAHPAFGSTNALIPFDDGSYLELIAFPGRMARGVGQSAPGKRFGRVRRAKGVADWALVTENLQQELERLRAAGQTWEGPISGYRRRPDSETVRWLFGIPANHALPFLCADVTPRAWRVPRGDARRHANGATGIAAITVAVADSGATRPAYAQLFDAAGTQSDDGTYTLGETVIRLVPAQRRREGITEVRLRGWDGSVG